jgi:hypothetical protein
MAVSLGDKVSDGTAAIDVRTSQGAWCAICFI